jgi:hypothetical protein
VLSVLLLGYETPSPCVRARVRFLSWHHSADTVTIDWILLWPLVALTEELQQQRDARGTKVIGRRICDERLSIVDQHC